MIRDIILSLLEKWLEIILAFKQGEISEIERDIKSKELLDKTTSQIESLWQEREGELRKKLGGVLFANTFLESAKIIKIISEVFGEGKENKCPTK